MTPGMTFRKDCPECNHSFTASDRNTRRCPKRLPKVKEREEKAKRAREKKPSPPPLPPAAKPPEEKGTVLTEALKARILEAYESRPNRTETPRRVVSREIAREMGLERALVARFFHNQQALRSSIWPLPSKSK